MTTFTTFPMPVNNYGDTKQVIVVENWEADYAKYLADGNFKYDQFGREIKADSNE